MNNMNNIMREGADSLFKEGYLIGGIIAILGSLPFIGIGLLTMVLALISGDESEIVGGLLFFIPSLCLVAVGVTFLLLYRSEKKKKKSSIFLDGVIISYQVDYQTRSKGLGGPANRMICRCHFADGSYRDFLSPPTWSDPNRFMGKIVRVYSNSSDFLSYTVDLDSAK